MINSLPLKHCRLDFSGALLGDGVSNDVNVQVSILRDEGLDIEMTIDR